MKIKMVGNELTERDVKAFRKIFSDWFNCDFSGIISFKGETEVVFDSK